MPTSKARLLLGVGDIDVDDGASAAPCSQLAGILASARSPRPGAFRRDELRTLADGMRAIRAERVFRAIFAETRRA
jgi:hypothetical protein